MKILHLNLELTWRGGERQTFLLVKELKNLGINSVMLARRGSPLALKCKSHQIPVLEVSSYLEAAKFLIRLRRKFNLVHCHTAKTQSVAVFTKKFHGLPVIYTRRVDFIPRGRLAKIKYKYTDCVVAISRKIKEIIEKFTHKPVELIYSAIEKKNLNKERAVRELTSVVPHFYDKKIIGTIAALVEHKDPFTLIKAIKKLRQKRDDFIVLHFGEGKLKEEILKMIHKENLQDCYFVMGFYEDVEDFFSIFDVFVLSSKEEGLGSSILDAFLYKVPVAATSAGGIPELLEKERGILCSVGDYESLAEGVDLLLRNTALRKKITEKAYDYVTKHHTPRIMAEKYKEIYERFIKT